MIDTHKLTPNLKRNIESYIVNLEYNKKDLQQMFNQYIENEDDDNLCSYNLKMSNPVKAFLGIDKIDNKYISTQEDAFDYIYRHSLKRPCDIMKICKKLSLENKELEINKIRNTVNNCAGEILNTYIKELEPFLPYGIEELFMHINTNVLNLNYIRFLCNRFVNQRNRQTGEMFACSRDCLKCTSIQPFNVLYNIGLLGYIKSDITNTIDIQQFNRAGDSVFLESIHQLPKSTYYFIHPCLMDAIRKKRDEYHLSHYTDNQHIIGDGYEFDKSKLDFIEKTIDISQQQLQKEDIFISSTIHDLKAEREVIQNTLIQRGYNVVMSEKTDFPLDAQVLLDVHSHDYCIDKLLECGVVICVIGKNMAVFILEVNTKNIKKK